jgi:hypothetical protein
MSRPYSPGERDQIPIVQEAGWAPRQVSMGAENLVRTGIRSPHIPVRSESLHLLSYTGPLDLCAFTVLSSSLRLNTRSSLPRRRENEKLWSVASRLALCWENAQWVLCKAWKGTFKEKINDWMSQKCWNPPNCLDCDHILNHMLEVTVLWQLSRRMSKRLGSAAVQGGRDWGKLVDTASSVLKMILW